MFDKFISYVRDIYSSKDEIPLHEPIFIGNEFKYVNETIKSTYVSSIGEYVETFEKLIEKYTSTTKAVATVNGTTALHVALKISGIKTGDLVITQPLTFIATCNALHYVGASPVFVDISDKSLSLCPKALEKYLDKNASVINSKCIHKKTKKQIKAILPMHTYGHPAQMEELIAIASKWKLIIIEDAAESLGSFYKGKHTGTLGDIGILSFNGNKIITSGGGGMILCNKNEDGVKAKHLTTTAKVPHDYEFFHDEHGFNYRLPNINAALGCAQMENLEKFLRRKRSLAAKYESFFKNSDIRFVKEPDYGQSNYWLNCIIVPDKKLRDEFLKKTNYEKIITRPAWTLMHHLPMYKNCLKGSLKVSEKIGSTLINIPSTPVI